MSDILQDVRDYFTDRFSNPLWVSIIVCWLLINWQIPITAIFETEKFNVDFVLSYLNKTPHWELVTAPIIAGLMYSIFSSSAKETLELLSKTIRSLITKIDRKGVFYKSISISEHELQLSKLKRQLKRIENDKEQLNEIILENTKLTEEKTNLTNKLTNITVEIEQYKAKYIQSQNERDELQIKLSTADRIAKDLEKEKVELRKKNEALNEKNENEVDNKNKYEELNIRSTEVANEASMLKERHKKITSILKRHINKFFNTELEESQKLIYALEKNGIPLMDSEVNKNLPIIKPTYYQTILENSDSHLKKELNNTNSLASIFLMLELLGGLSDYKPYELSKISGAPENFFNKTLNLISGAEWLGKDFFENPELSAAGKKKLHELKNDPSLSKLKDIMLAIDKESEKSILSALEENHLPHDELMKKTYFTPNIRNLLQRLIDTGEIKKSGKIYSLK